MIPLAIMAFFGLQIAATSLPPDEILRLGRRTGFLTATANRLRKFFHNSEKTQPVVKADSQAALHTRALRTRSRLIMTAHICDEKAL